MVKCSRCSETDIVKFWKKTNSKTGYNTWCKECCKVSARVSSKTNKDIIKGVIRNSIVVENKILKAENKKICCKCKEIFTFKKESEIRCKKCEAEKFKLYRSKNLEKERKRSLENNGKGKEMIDLSKKTPKELIKLLDSVKVSDLEFNEKTALIKEIEFKLNGTRDKNTEALKQIEESQADVSDIVGQIAR